MLVDTLARSGDWLFRRRSYLPVALFAPVIVETLRAPGAAERALSPTWGACCLAVAVLGLVIRVAAVGVAPEGTSGRNTHGQVATSLNTTGLYSVVRHPLYVGNTLLWLGPALLPGSWLLAALVVALVVLFYERIVAAEEAFLRTRFPGVYDAWAARTPAVWALAVVDGKGPRRRWRRSALPFSWRAALRREYSGLFGMTAAFVAVELVASYAVGGRLTLGRGWALLFVAGLVVYGVLRALKRHTRVLHVHGR